MGFHPEDENNAFLLNVNSYNIRKESSMYIDSFECLIIDENSIEDNNICAYCFVYIDRQSCSAFIEPVCTRDKYRRKGFGKALMNGVIIRCKEKNIQKCYVNSFDWRKKFYNSVGFISESEISFWHKVIK